jgi:TPP-dependent pyruvate/acetoin dehydrogenase alpha subunit
LRFLPSNSSYRSRDEIQSVRKTQDPIAGLKERLLGADLATDEDIKVGERIRTQG